MIGIVKRTSITVRSSVHRGLPTAIAVAALLSVVLVGDQANAQFYRGFRARGPVFVGPPIVPSPFYRGAWPASPIVVGPPSSVRVQTPFFSLNLGPGAIVPPPYAVYDYRYESYRPHYDSRYESPYQYGYAEPRSTVPQATVPGYRSTPPSRFAPGESELNQSYGRYRSGNSGGIPDVTPPARFSLAALRDAAETLYRSLDQRPDDGDVWLKYLQPERIIAAVDSGQLSPSIDELYTRFQGVTMNPDLVVMTRIAGFLQTYQLLGRWIELERETPVAGNVEPSGVTESSQQATSPQETPQPEARQEILPAPRGQVDEL